MTLAQLEAWKSRYGSVDPAPLERLLGDAARQKWRDAASLIRLHETALFLRAFPHNAQIARQADAILAAFASRVAALPTGEREVLSDPEISGIDGSELTAVFSHDVAQSLAARHGDHVEIAWDCLDNPDRLGHLLARLIPLLAEDWPVEAHVPYREWLPPKPLLWLLARSTPDVYDPLEVPLTWRVERRMSRSRLRLPGRRLFCHSEPLLRRADVSLAAELAGPPLPVKQVVRAEARKILDLILDTSAMRYRELYGFSHPDEAAVFHADAGRGVDIYFFGVPPEWRLPLRAYHAGMFFKNGVPAGYVELLSLFERAETGFNLYYTFREGESAWLYARLLRLFHQVLGVTCFSIDPYQIGLENPEAVESGAFWFYRKLGFRPVNPAVAALTEREERRMRTSPGHRSSRRKLEKLAADYLIYEAPGVQAGAWDRFRIRRLAQRIQRKGGDVLRAIPGYHSWSADEKAAAEQVMRAKQKGSEARYLRLMHRHTRLRAALLAMGS